jgi:hypothetical protein
MMESILGSVPNIPLFEWDFFIRYFVDALLQQVA